MARRYYRMTAARKAALRKAQIASAKKRKRRRTKVIATASFVAVGGGAIGGYKVKQRRVAKAQAAHQAWSANVYQKWAQNAMKKPSVPAIENKKDVTTFGKIRIGGGVIVDKSGKQRGNRIGLAGPRQAGEAQGLNLDRAAFRVGSKGPKSTRAIKTLRTERDASRRADYDKNKRHRKYLNWDKPRRQAQAAKRKQAKGK